MGTYFLRIQAVTDKDRQAIISDVKEAINRYGWISDFHQFSNSSICINFDLPFKSIEPFYNSLKDTTVKLSEESIKDVERYISILAEKGNIDSELVCAINITFFHNEPDMRIFVPAVPG